MTLQVYLSDPEGAKATAKAIVDSWAVVPYGSTYGTAFLPDRRLEIARVRQEKGPSLATISLVATYKDAIEWLDLEKLHPLFHKLIKSNQLQIFENISFIRFPISPEYQKLLSPYSINAQGAIQVFFVHDSDPIITALKDYHHVSHYAVRSSNLEGESEKYIASEALVYAQQIEAPILALLDPDVQRREKFRHRVMSQPSLELSTDSPQLILRRAGSTHPETLQKISRHFLAHGIDFVIAEDKVPAFARPQYNSKYSRPQAIRNDLLRASGLIFKKV